MQTPFLIQQSAALFLIANAGYWEPMLSPFSSPRYNQQVNLELIFTSVKNTFGCFS